MESKCSGLMISASIIPALRQAEVQIISAHQIATLTRTTRNSVSRKHTHTRETAAHAHTLTTKGQIHALFMRSFVWAAALCKPGVHH